MTSLSQVSSPLQKIPCGKTKLGLTSFFTGSSQAWVSLKTFETRSRSHVVSDKLNSHANFSSHVKSFANQVSFVLLCVTFLIFSHSHWVSHWLLKWCVYLGVSICKRKKEKDVYISLCFYVCFLCTIGPFVCTLYSSYKAYHTFWCPQYVCGCLCLTYWETGDLWYHYMSQGSTKAR